MIPMEYLSLRQRRTIHNIRLKHPEFASPTPAWQEMKAGSKDRFISHYNLNLQSITKYCTIFQQGQKLSLKSKHQRSYMKTIQQWLNLPYPAPDTHQARWMMSLMVGVIVFAILMLFQPFGIRSIEGIRTLVIAGYGAISTATYLVLSYLIIILRALKLINDEWTIFRQICFILILLAVITFSNWQLNFSISSVVEVPMYSLRDFKFMTLAVGFLPVIIVIYFREKTLRKQNEETAETLSKKLHKFGKTIVDLPVAPAKFLYAKAEGNYVQIFTCTSVPITIRCTMKELEKQYTETGLFIRCHRSYLVHINAISEVSGTASGLVLSLSNGDKIPVSRAETSLVKDLLFNRIQKM